MKLAKVQSIYMEHAAKETSFFFLQNWLMLFLLSSTKNVSDFLSNQKYCGRNFVLLFIGFLC